MVIFNSYVKLPEGSGYIAIYCNHWVVSIIMCQKPVQVDQNHRPGEHVPNHRGLSVNFVTVKRHLFRKKNVGKYQGRNVAKVCWKI